MWTSFIPFPTSVLGDYHYNRMSVSLNGVVMALMAASFSFLRFYASRRSGLPEDSVDLTQFRQGTYSSVIFDPVMYLLGSAQGFIHKYPSFTIYLGILVYFFPRHRYNK